MTHAIFRTEPPLMRLSPSSPRRRTSHTLIEVKYSEGCTGPAATHRPRYDEASREVALHHDPDAPALRSTLLEQFWRLHLLAQLAVVTRSRRARIFSCCTPITTAASARPPASTPRNFATPRVHHRPPPSASPPYPWKPSSPNWRRRAAAQKRPTFITATSISALFSISSCWLPARPVTSHLRVRPPRTAVASVRA